MAQVGTGAEGNSRAGGAQLKNDQFVAVITAAPSG
jgi:hypothetical protein